MAWCDGQSGGWISVIAPPVLGMISTTALCASISMLLPYCLDFSSYYFCPYNRKCPSFHHLIALVWYLTIKHKVSKDPPSPKSAKFTRAPKPRPTPPLSAAAPRKICTRHCPRPCNPALNTSLQDGWKTLFMISWRKGAITYAFYIDF